MTAIHQRFQPITFISLRAITLLVATSFSSIVVAKDYQVEAILFANNEGHTAFESSHYQPIANLTSEAETWPLRPTLLLDEARAINGSQNYTLLAHHSWGQEALPTSEAAIFSVADRDTRGWIKVYASHLLFANLDLDFNGYRMIEKRRLKLNEKHYFDHPKFGVYLTVSRWKGEEATR